MTKTINTSRGIVKSVASLLGAMGLSIFAVGLASAQDADQGRAHFMQHCASCHGANAQGNGPMAGVLLVQPTDLTRLSGTNDGVFPTVRVVMRIDGRDPLESHGSPMPVYGDFFQTVQDVPLKAPSGQPILTSAPIADLVAYLNTVQSSQ